MERTSLGELNSKFEYFMDGMHKRSDEKFRAFNDIKRDLTARIKWIKIMSIVASSCVLILLGVLIWRQM